MHQVRILRGFETCVAKPNSAAAVSVPTANLLSNSRGICIWIGARTAPILYPSQGTNYFRFGSIATNRGPILVARSWGHSRPKVAKADVGTVHVGYQGQSEHRRPTPQMTRIAMSRVGQDKLAKDRR